jgi:thiol-disulfide isomerase/thioredoxin
VIIVTITILKYFGNIVKSGVDISWKTLVPMSCFGYLLIGVYMRKSIMFVLIGLIVFAASAAATTVTAEEFRQRGLQPPKQRVESIDFELQDLSGTTRRLSDFKGKVVFLNFWATWCGPCRFEMPSMEKLYQRFKVKGLEIVAVNLQEDRNSVQRFVDEYDLSFPVLLDTTGRIGATYGARSIPTTYIVDREGFVLAGTIGTREWDTEDYFRFFEKLLAE